MNSRLFIYIKKKITERTEGTENDNNFVVSASWYEN